MFLSERRNKSNNMTDLIPSLKQSLPSRRKPKAGGRNSKEQLANTRLASYCRALGQPVRVRILKLLINEHCMFSDLSRRIPLAQSTISQHLKILAAAGLIDAASVGKSTCYCINQDHIKSLKQIVAQL